SFFILQSTHKKNTNFLVYLVHSFFKKKRYLKFYFSLFWREKVDLYMINPARKMPAISVEEQQSMDKVKNERTKLQNLATRLKSIDKDIEQNDKILRETIRLRINQLRNDLDDREQKLYKECDTIKSKHFKEITNKQKEIAEYMQIIEQAVKLQDDIVEDEPLSTREGGRGTVVSGLSSLNFGGDSPITSQHSKNPVENRKHLILSIEEGYLNENFSFNVPIKPRELTCSTLEDIRSAIQNFGELNVSQKDFDAIHRMANMPGGVQSRK
ncbi:hypothetical protein RFI_17084, partial [Reticulomyxa filosa]